MKKRMEALTVETNNDSVTISQDDYGDGPDNISIPYEQIDTLIKWLQDAKVELEKK